MLFLRDDESRRLWPHHFFGWRNASTVTFDPAHVLAPSIPAFDLVARLAAVPAAQVEAMRASIAANAHRIAYFADESVPREDDALDVALKGLAFGLPG